MKVEIKIQEDVIDPYAVLYTSAITQEIQDIAAALEGKSGFIAARDNGRIVFLQPQEVFLVRMENEKVILYGETKQYMSDKRLYEVENQLGMDFMRISKSVLVNLKQMGSVEVSLSGLMLLTLKNGSQDYISRKYLPKFKEYLGL